MESDYCEMYVVHRMFSLHNGGSVTYDCLVKLRRDRHPWLRPSYVDYCVRCKLSLRQLINAPMKAFHPIMWWKEEV